ncbi:MAG: hypothetical protein HUU31_24175 [Anaerolineae bacterium]|nr:hypothetical protein [Anaerolineae bacterium]
MRMKLIKRPERQKRCGTAVKEAIESFKDDHDILDLLSEHSDFKRVASTHGGEWEGMCPFEDCISDDNACRVWRERDGGAAWCRQCKRRGDSLRWSMMLEDRDPDEPGETSKYLREKGYLAKSLFAKGDDDDDE